MSQPSFSSRGSTARENPTSARQTPNSARQAPNSARRRRASEMGGAPPRSARGKDMDPQLSSALHAVSNAMKVYVRVRPYSEREITAKASCHSTVRIDADNPSIITILDPTNGFRQLSTYKFTRCFWSVFQKSEQNICHAVDTVLLGGMNVEARSRAASVVQTIARPDSDAPPTYVGSGSNPVNAVDPEVTHPPYASQGEVYEHVGKPVLLNTLDGYNGCVFAYGQTGSGKTFTMMGYAPATSDVKKIRSRRQSVIGSNPNLENSTSNSEVFGRRDSPDADLPYSAENEDEMDDVVDKTGMDPNDLQGIIPRICADLFSGLRETRRTDESRSFRVAVSYYEIYNEKVYDLIRPRGDGDLKIRNNPSTGPFIENLASKKVLREEDIARVIRKGMQERHTAATKYNDRSSRSHAILTINTVQIYFEQEEMCTLESKLNLVDLAGSERTGKGGAEGLEMKTGININLSLTVLGRVIDCLADLSQNKSLSVPVPYRDSNLTWLLSDSIGGNSQTSMVATISPHSINYEEMRQTLRYASRAKQVINRATRNEDPQVALIRRLRGEVERLQQLLKEAGGNEYTKEYVEGLEQRCKDLEMQLVEQESQLASLRAELEMAGISDPTRESKADENNGGVVRGANYKAAVEELQTQLVEAHDEIAELHKRVLESSKKTVDLTEVKKLQEQLKELQGKYNQAVSDNRDRDLAMKSFGVYHMERVTETLFNTFAEKMDAALRGCGRMLASKAHEMQDNLNKRNVSSMIEANELQKKHEEEIAELVKRHRAALDALQAEASTKTSDIEQRYRDAVHMSDDKILRANEGFEQERKRFALERENLKLQYEDQLNKARMSYQEDLQRLRDTLGSGTQDRQRLNDTVRTLEESHEREVRQLKEEMASLTSKHDSELQRLRKQQAAELDKRAAQVEERERQKKKVEDELVDMRRENMKLDADRKRAEKDFKDQLKESLTQQEHLLTIIGSVCTDYEKKSPVFDGDMAALKDLLKDKDYTVFRQKAKELAYSGLRSKKDYSKEAKDVEQKKDQEMEEYRRAMEAMRKTREERQKKLEMLRKGVYDDKMSS